MHPTIGVEFTVLTQRADANDNSPYNSPTIDVWQKFARHTKALLSCAVPRAFVILQTFKFFVLIYKAMALVLLPSGFNPKNPT